jgi:hypothetical protein
MTALKSETIGRAFVAQARRRLAEYYERIFHCVNQLEDTQLWYRPRPDMNSIANIMLHLGGNLRQWIVAGVRGAYDDRDRPAEFAERGPLSKDELLQRLQAAVAAADSTLAGVPDEQLLEPRRIQGFDETVLSAVFGSLTHLGGHTQEIVYISRLLLGDAYRFAWAPATPEQGAPAAPGPQEETDAVRDAVFEHGLQLPPGAGRRTLGSGMSDAPLGDYLRDIQQEFQDEEDEGKLGRP